jgi:transposase
MRIHKPELLKLRKAPQDPKGPKGRPPSFNSEEKELVIKLAGDGYSFKSIAESFDVNRNTIYRVISESK